MVDLNLYEPADIIIYEEYADNRQDGTMKRKLIWICFISSAMHPKFC